MPSPASASAASTWKPISAPVALERSSSRSPVASLSTVAVTPASESLICFAMSASVSLPSSTVISTGVSVPATKLPLPQLPRVMVSVPAPRPLPAGTTALEVFCACARRCTSREKPVGGVPAATVTPIDSGSEDVALTALKAFASASLAPASPRVVTSELMVP